MEIINKLFNFIGWLLGYIVLTIFRLLYLAMVIIMSVFNWPRIPALIASWAQEDKQSWNRRWHKEEYAKQQEQFYNQYQNWWDQNQQRTNYSDWGNYQNQQGYNSFQPQVNNELTNAYITLEVDENISDDELKKAYKKLAIKYHPDRNDSEDAKVKMMKINSAYTLIKQVRGI